MLSIEELGNKYNNTQLLVILLARLYFKQAEPGVVQQFIRTQPVNWALFQQLLAAHGIRSFAYNVIAAHQLSIDEQTGARLKNHALLANINNLHQVKFLNHLLKAFQSAGVKAIPYKGVSFAAKYYEAPVYRESSDLDFLIPKKTVAQLRSYFHQQGYQPKEDVPDAYLNYIIATGKELSFKTPPDALGVNCSIEIQWKLVEDFIGPFPQYDFFAPHLLPAGTDARVGLTPTYDFICLASHHFIREPLTRFKYLIDAACLISKHGDELDTPLITHLFQRLGYSRFMDEAMRNLNELLGVALPGLVSAAPPANLPVRNLVAYPVVDKVEFSNLRSLGLLFNFQRSAWAKLRLALRIGWYSMLPGMGDVQQYNLPWYGFPLFVVLRPYRLLMNKWGKGKSTAVTAVKLLAHESW